MIIIDENVDQVLIDRLGTENFETFSIRHQHAGISDREVINIAKEKKGLIITEDKDFGELVFSYNIRDCSVILLRYDKQDYENIVKNLVQVITNYYEKPGHVFITITKNKIRVRKI